MQPTKELIEYLQTQSAAGYDVVALNNAMLGVGWSQDSIDAAWQQIRPQTISNAVPSTPLSPGRSSFVRQPMQTDTSRTFSSSSVASPVSVARVYTSATNTSIPTLPVQPGPSTFSVPAAATSSMVGAPPETPVNIPSSIAAPSTSNVLPSSVNRVERPRRRRLFVQFFILIIIASAVWAAISMNILNRDLVDRGIDRLTTLSSKVAFINNALPVIRSTLARFIPGIPFSNPSESSKSITTNTSKEVIDTAFARLRQSPRVHMTTEARITFATSDDAGAAAEDIRVTIETSRVRDPEYQSFVTVRAATDKAVEIDAAWHSTSEKAVVHIAALSLLDIMGITGFADDWVLLSQPITDIALLDRLDLPGELFGATLRALQQLRIQGNSFPRMLLDQGTLVLGDPTQTLLDITPVLHYQGHIDVSNMMDAIARIIRDNGGLSIPAENSLRASLSAFSNVEVDFMIDTITGNIRQFAFSMQSIAPDGSDISIQGTTAFIYELPVPLSETPSSTITAENFITNIAKALETLSQ